MAASQDKKTEPIELTARDGNGKLPLLPNYPTETLWRIEEKIKHFLDNHDGDDEDQMVRISQAWLTVLQNLDLDANAAYRSLPNVPGPHSKDEDVKGHGAWAYGSRTRNAKSLEDKHLISDRTEGVTHSYILPGLRHQKDPNKETTAPGPSTIADSAANPRINKQGPIGLANEATTAQDLTGPLDSIAPTVVDPDQQEASALAPRVAKPDYTATIPESLTPEPPDKTSGNQTSEPSSQDQTADDTERGGDRGSSHLSSNPARRAHFRTALTISSVAVIVLIAIEVFLSGFIAYYEATHPDHNPHSVTAYLEFAHKAIRNLGPLLLVVVGIIHERSKDIDRVNMRLFVGMIVLFVLTLAAAIVLASFTWLIWAHLGLDLGNVWFLLTTLFYFQFVLKG